MGYQNAAECAVKIKLQWISIKPVISTCLLKTYRKCPFSLHVNVLIRSPEINYGIASKSTLSIDDPQTVLAGTIPREPQHLNHLLVLFSQWTSCANNQVVKENNQNTFFKKRSYSLREGASYFRWMYKEHQNFFSRNNLLLQRVHKICPGLGLTNTLWP